jgi:SAM-dependent methyltransferase
MMGRVSQPDDAAIRRSFAQQVEAFRGPDSVYAAQSVDAAAWVGPVSRTTMVLEVACGAGHVAEVIAPHVRAVVGVDLTPELLEVGARRLAEAGVQNVVLQEGNASRLPFVDGTFDVVCCRASVHHFADRPAAVAEMVRVCRRGGRIAINDLVAPSPGVRHEFDRLHRLLDPSHVACALEDELATMWPADATLTRRETMVVRFPVTVAISEVSEPAPVMAALGAEIAGGPKTGFEPTRVGDDIEVAFVMTTVHASR